MLRVYHSNRLDVLEEIMAFIMERQPLGDPFEPETVLVQSVGMSQWLQMMLARRFGIAANIHFPLPSRFIWEMFVRVLPDIPQESAFSKSSMTWKLMSLLPGCLELPEFETLRLYLAEDSDCRKQYQLASRVADLFDHYLIYRPQWLLRWEAGGEVEGLSEVQRWQATLWRKLSELTDNLGQPRWHRANLYSRFIHALEQAKTCPPGLPSRIFICGIPALPPVYLNALQALGRHIEIHLLFTNPCRYYWGDIKDPAFLARLVGKQRRKHNSDCAQPLFKDSAGAAGLFNDDGVQEVSNPLLASWGKLGRDYSFLLSGLEQAQEVDAFVDMPDDNMLHRLQGDLLELQDSEVAGLTEDAFERSDNKRRLDPGDRSISIHICHSPQREVEVLHDQLLAMLENDPTLTPRDIIVMVADIDSYSPFIQAVFGSADGDRRLPFAISDRRARQAHPAVQAFLTLLSLPDSRFVSEDVLALLEVPALAARFNIDEEGLQFLRQWVEESGVRWGLDDNNVRDIGLPVTGQHTWQFGLTRMLLGYAMDSEAGEWQSVLPYDESSGLIAGLVGHLADLLAQLNRWRIALAQPRTLAQWLALCRDMLNAFFLPDPDAEAALALIEQHWQTLIKQGTEACYQKEVPLTLLRDELAFRLDQERISQRFLAGPVNFCTLMPMRSIPFRVVCLLGMNDGVYPRVLPPPGFDLMSEKPERGDRSRRDDDRYLFLEALVSAQQRLWISYIGRSVQDNSERFPSVLVEELVNYIAHSHYLPGDEACDSDESAQRVARHITCEHPRTPFDAACFIRDGEFQSYAREWLAAASEQGAAPPAFIQPLVAQPLEEISLEQLQRFWGHPVRAFFQMRLRVNFARQESGLADTEPFSLDALKRFRMNQQLLNALVRQQDPQALYRRYRAAGELPYGAFGDILWEAQHDEMQALARKVLQARQPGENREINLQVGDVRLTGWLHDVQPDGLLRWRPSLLRMPHGLQLWLEHLVYCVSGGEGSSRLLGRREGMWSFPVLAHEEALALLTALVEGYREGMREPLILLPDSGGAWLKTCYDAQNDSISWDEETQRKARAKLAQAWEGNQTIAGEGNDIWLQRLWRTLDDDYYQAIVREAQRWLLPMLRHHRASDC
ncbi:exodeoxyribonuclease V subunit gamma [Enterobacteriaceae bacterium YMB-R22]|uniref:exodeoxyribonuclease V subunit gamma n=1 Tax=Tenebrionicola larvae TaxID=2815733 RepID=UPI002012B54D|nr:exodeoxyribonuclease V subunit gamma [Tenebrionicola larvae]MBV4412672.1 exodeoxyribonuclease V subunit gamma [Tenebrionicola larvae]